MTPADLTACPKCGASLRAAWNACPACGTWLADRPRPLGRPWADIGISPVLEDAENVEHIERARMERELRNPKPTNQSPYNRRKGS